MIIYCNPTKESLNKPVADLDSQKKGTEGMEVDCFQFQALNDFKAILNEYSTPNIIVKVVLGEERTFFVIKPFFDVFTKIIS